jgi:hypothetical protein
MGAREQKVVVLLGIDLTDHFGVGGNRHEFCGTTGGISRVAPTVETDDESAT